MSRFRHLLRTRREDQGIALVMVLGISSVLLGLVFATTTYAVQSNKTGRLDQDDQAALRAAEAGLDHYLDKLNSRANYFASGDCQNKALWGPRYQAAGTSSTYSCVAKPQRGWLPVPGRANGGEFHYHADTASTPSTGAITLTVTGRVPACPAGVECGSPERAIRVTLRRSSFLDFLYFSDKETLDTALQSGGTSCDRYLYDGRPNSCTFIRWVSADTVDGPLHTNDTLVVDGNPRFNGRTSTGWNDPNRKNWYDYSGTASRPVFTVGGKPITDGVLNLPSTNANIRRQTDSAFTSTPGCRYQGPTRIVLDAGGTGRNDGQMTVHSPRTTTVNAGCPLNGRGSLPRNGVVYVDPAPSTTTCSDSTYPYVGGGSTGVAGFPQPGDASTQPVYRCRDANVFIEGVLDGQLTVASEHNVIVTGDLTYAGGTCTSCTDVLGLIGTQYVWVYHPVNASGTGLARDMRLPNGRYFDNPRIEAAIASNLHSFMVQNYALGAPREGALNVTGAIIQKFRGPVGTSSGANRATGYAKNYVYDKRLQILSPPFFLAPEATQWLAKDYTEVQPDPAL